MIVCDHRPLSSLEAPQVVSLEVRVLMTLSKNEILREDRCSWELCYEVRDVLLILVVYAENTSFRCNKD